jgi:AraC-like DNA-binding protein
MIFNFEEKASDSPFVELVWRNYSEPGGPFISMAISNWQMVFSKVNNKVKITIRGPETRATQALCPPEAEHFGIYFKVGTVFTFIPPGLLKDGMIDLPGAGDDTFWLNGSVWQYPNYENVEGFIQRLAREGYLYQEPLVAAVLQPYRHGISLRTVQRRFLTATGLTHQALSQIDRARDATRMLLQGKSILDTVAEAGYADQPHLTRSLKYFIGQTPAQLYRDNQSIQLSFLSAISQGIQEAF